MGHKKRTSRIYEIANKRSDALKSIDPNLDLGNGLTLEAINAKIQNVRAKMEAHNIALTTADATSNDLTVAEQELKDIYGLILSGIAVKYGKNSNEYEMAGGVRKSERKRPVRKSTPKE